MLMSHSPEPDVYVTDGGMGVSGCSPSLMQVTSVSDG